MALYKQITASNQVKVGLTKLKSEMRVDWC
jgi:hypothetical protein